MVRPFFMCTHLRESAEETHHANPYRGGLTSTWPFYGCLCKEVLLMLVIFY
jgi:hypothetical protein